MTQVFVAVLMLHFVDVPLVELSNLAFTAMPGESSCKRLGSLLILLCSCDVFQALITSSIHVC